METKKLTRKDFIEKDGFLFFKEKELKFEGNIQIEANLGYVRFEKSLVAKGYIFAEAGSGIEAGEGIKAGLGIEAGLQGCFPIRSLWQP